MNGNYLKWMLAVFFMIFLFEAGLAQAYVRGERAAVDRRGVNRNYQAAHPNYNRAQNVNAVHNAGYNWNGKHYNYYHNGQYYNYYHNGNYYNYYNNGAYYNYFYNGAYYNYLVNGVYYLYYVNGVYYNNCKWVNGYWSNGVWIPKKQVCS